MGIVTLYQQVERFTIPKTTKCSEKQPNYNNSNTYSKNSRP